MPITMHKLLFLKTNIDGLKKPMHKKIVLNAYNNPCTPQMGMCQISTINKGIKY